MCVVTEGHDINFGLHTTLPGGCGPTQMGPCSFPGDLAGLAQPLCPAGGSGLGPGSMGFMVFIPCVTSDSWAWPSNGNVVVTSSEDETAEEAKVKRKGRDKMGMETEAKSNPFSSQCKQQGPIFNLYCEEKSSLAHVLLHSCLVGSLITSEVSASPP